MRVSFVCAGVAAVFFAACSFVSAKPYLDIQEIKTEDGLDVWFVQDDAVPVVSLKFSVAGGAAYDPQGKEGATTLLTTLLDEGAGTRDAEAFQDDLDSNGVQIGFSATRDYFYGSLKTTTQYQRIGFELFHDALNKPHLKDEAVARMKDALLSSLRFKKMSPQWIASRQLFETVFENQDYARPTEGTEKSLRSLTAKDMAAQKNKLFCRDNLKIAVVGDVSADDVRRMVTRFFGAWPSCQQNKELVPQKMAHAGETIRVTWGGAQHVVVMAQAGLARQDKDWWAARLLDFSLGGGQFSSRLMDEVRVKQGLTYGVSSGIATYDRAPMWMVQSSVDPQKTDQAITVIKKIWGDVADNGLIDTEIKAGKDYLIGVMSLSLTSTDQIASIVLQLQQDNLPKNTLDVRATEINAVTAADIKRVAKERLHANALTTVIVGPAQKEK